MPSPFPGMDPFIEMFAWQDFHSRLVTATADALEVGLAERYVIRVEKRVYVEFDSDERSHRVPDIAIVDDRPDNTSIQLAAADSATAVLPIECELPMLDEHRESYLVIRDDETKDVVTVVEVLSPTNKRRGSFGREEYLKKRELILRSNANLVEFDLLRDGARLPMAAPLPPADYYAIVSRAEKRPRADVYGWSLMQRIPDINVPVLPSDPDIPLDLQSVVNLVYKRARYRSLDYAAKLIPSLAGGNNRAVRELLAAYRDHQ